MKAIRIFLLTLIIIGIGLLITQKFWVPKLVDHILKSENNSPVEQNMTVSNQVIKWQTYTNTKYSYGFSYPSNSELVTYGEAGKRIPTTNTSYAVGVNVGSTTLVEIRDNGANKTLLNKEQIYKILLGDLSNSEQARSTYTINPVEIGGISGFEVISKTNFKQYFVKRNLEDPILDITVWTDNPITQKIVSSLQFNK